MIVYKTPISQSVSQSVYLLGATRIFDRGNFLFFFTLQCSVIYVKNIYLTFIICSHNARAEHNITE